jgi:GT2 family glycosyltransferase
VVDVPDIFASPDDEPDRPDEPPEALGAPPPVVAVVVAHDPGDWFEDCLRSLGAQDYPAISVLVVDAASEEDPTPRVAAVLPNAYVRRLADNAGYGASANEVLSVVEGAAFYVFCHDDVALAPDAVRAMVEEAFRSNAGIVAPKMVRWDDEHRLLSVGIAADKTGVPSPMVEPGELDQEQHDGVRDVFAAPGGVTLVRADLFSVLGGFDAAIDFLGEDIDLCWRAQVAGARVIVAPAAVVRHVEALDTRCPVDERRARQSRHRLRTMLTCYGPVHLLRVVPQTILLALGELVYGLASGRVSQARDVVHAWRWNLARAGEIKANRRRLASLRQLPDSEIRRLQARGSTRVVAFLRGQIGGASDDRLQSVTSASRDLAGSLRRGPRRTTVAVCAAVVIVLLFGSRQLLVGHLPAFADDPNFPQRPWTLFTQWFSGWRNAGLGSESPAPTAYALLGTLGFLTLGSMALLHRLLFLAMLPTGAIGAWRLARDTGSARARVVALVMYVAIPLPYNAIAGGHWGGLLLWAGAPWLLRALARAAGAAPFPPFASAPRRVVLALGLATAVIGAFVPIALVVVIVVGAGVALGGALAGTTRGAGRAFGTAVGAVAIAIVLHVPWTFDFVLPGSQWSAIGGVRSTAGASSIGELLRFHTGPLGGNALGWAFLVVAALPLAIGREWRLTLATRAWAVALTCWTVAWIGQQSWFHFGLGPPEALLAPAAAGLALSAALGVVAFEVDLRGYRFGWRQVASVAAAGALALGALPVLANSFDGRWGAPRDGYGPVLGFLQSEQETAGPFRVMWLGDPDVLPLAGWQLDDGVAYATTDHGLPTVQDRWAGSSDGATGLLADAVHLAERRDTSRLGRLLAPMAVRYIVVVRAVAPADAPLHPLPAVLEQALGEQLDLQQVLADPHVAVYRNAAWAPARALLPAAAASAAQRSPFFDVAAATDLSGAPPALVEQSGYATATGPVPDAATLYLADASSPRWSLTVDGRNAPRSKAFGWANSFTIDKGGHAMLTFSTPATRYGLLVIEAALWIGAVRRLRRWRVRPGAQP